VKVGRSKNVASVTFIPYLHLLPPPKCLKQISVMFLSREPYPLASPLHDAARTSTGCRQGRRIYHHRRSSHRRSVTSTCCHGSPTLPPSSFSVPDVKPNLAVAWSKPKEADKSPMSPSTSLLQTPSSSCDLQRQSILPCMKFSA
jgi:hypothetical protein